jgi:hypothetical protein
MRNAVKRVTHKERAQPSARKKFGLLEKHKVNRDHSLTSIAVSISPTSISLTSIPLTPSLLTHSSRHPPTAPQGPRPKPR